jgi:hypothetical protein
MENKPGPTNYNYGPNVVKLSDEAGKLVRGICYGPNQGPTQVSTTLDLSRYSADKTPNLEYRPKEYQPYV